MVAKVMHSGKAIIRAGELLISPGIIETDPDGYSEAMDILSSWRSCHVEPLEQASKFLQKEASRLDRRSMVAKRLKRAPSIIAKLGRYSGSGMKLKNMQDIGGCRVILSSEKNVQKLMRKIRGEFQLRIKNDYILDPKADGYRSVHLVGKFPDKTGELRMIEVQLRSAIQHAWATAVEITDLFTQQSIKTSQGKGEWRDFFRYASMQFAYFEEIPLFHNMDINNKAMSVYKLLLKTRDKDRHEPMHKNSFNLMRLMESLNVIEEFNGFANSIKVADDQCIDAKIEEGFVLLEVDLVAHKVKSRLLSREETAFEYAKAERTAGGNPSVVVALVSTDSLGGLREAYPNYFADSTLFLENLIAFRDAYKEIRPSSLFDKIFGR